MSHQPPPIKEPRSKRPKTAGAMASSSLSSTGPAHVAHYHYSASNVFTRMQTGLLPAETLVFDRPHTFALLDIRPASRGHALLVLKHPAATLLDALPDDALADVMRDLQVLSRAVQAATDCAGLKVLQNNGPAAGQTIPQLHFHVIPCYPEPQPALQSGSPSGSAVATAQQASQPGGAAETSARVGPEGQQQGQQERPSGLPQGEATAGTSEAGQKVASVAVSQQAMLPSEPGLPAPAALPRPALAESDAGPLVARLRNLLPPSYASGFYAWAAGCDEMESLGAALQQALGGPGTVFLLHGHLGAGKSTIARGFVRSALGDPALDVPSPTFLLCLSYKEDLGHDAQARQQQQQQLQLQDGMTQQAAGQQQGTGQQQALPAGHEPSALADAASSSLAAGSGREQQGDGDAAAVTPAPSSSAPAAASRLLPTVHHMDPYRLGAKADKMAGLIDFESAFRQDVCLIEWPDRMPAEVMKLPMRGVTVHVSGTGTQGAGRLVCVQPLTPDDPSAKVLDAWRKAGRYPQAIAPSSAAGRASGPVGPDAAPGASGFEPPATSGSSVDGARFKALPTDPSQWLVLGIESSCDDTAAAVVTGDGVVKAHRIASQAGLHEQYGGIKPDVARDAHAAAILETVDGCLAEAGVSPDQLSAIAVTVGPGLSLCLQVGVQHALTLAARHRLPVVPVHHMEAHALMTRLPSLNPAPTTFPALLLLVSGGHNMLVFSEGVGRHRIVGTTLDDSAGECFDKVARLLGVTAIPGGPHLERLADQGEEMLAAVASAASAAAAAAGASEAEQSAAGTRAAARELSRYEVTMPMQNGAHRDSCNFSFSGLKTSAAKLVESERVRLGLPAQAYTGPGSNLVSKPKDSGEQRQQQQEQESPHDQDQDLSASAAREQELHRSTCLIAASLQRVAVRFLQQRTRRALEWLAEDAAQHGGPPVSCLVIAGGVAANRSVRAGLEAVATAAGIPCVCPPVRYCMDNGLMVAWTGVERLKLGLFRSPPLSEAAVAANVDVLPRWPIGPVDPRSAACKSLN